MLRALVECGTEGVQLYAEMAQLAHDNEIPEVFLGGFIARKLFGGTREQHPHSRVQIETLYTNIAIAHGAEPDVDLMRKFGGQRADIFVCNQRDQLDSVIELKIFDERDPSGNAVISDLDKICALQAVTTPIDGILGVMICELPRFNLQDRIALLNGRLKNQLVTGNIVENRLGGWKWCFGCARV
jgi:hypothetical protein